METRIKVQSSQRFRELESVAAVRQEHQNRAVLPSHPGEIWGSAAAGRRGTTNKTAKQGRGEERD